MIELQQAVHGYSDGHRKLASSCILSKDSERQLLVLSDLSGIGGSEAFDSYLTGYPIESGKYYAFARTWSAPEMRRPGCVWTHTLLIESNQFAEIEEPDSLREFFRRPALDTDFDTYRKPLHIQGLPRKQGRPGARWGQELVMALYEGPFLPVVIQVAKYDVAEDPFLAIWRTQWLSLQRSFTFCSGVRAPRSLDGVTFHLQAALPRDIRRFEKSSAEFKIVEEKPVPQTFENWIDVGTDAYENRDHALASFFRSLGSSVPGDVSLFRPLTNVFQILNSQAEHRVRELIQCVTREFPRPEEAVSLKQLLLVDNVAAVPEWELVKELALTSEFASFNADQLDIENRASALWQSEDRAWNVLTALAGSNHTPFAAQAMTGFVKTLPRSCLQRLLSLNAPALAEILELNPRLALSAELWSDAERLPIIAEAMWASRAVLHEHTEAIIRTALDARADLSCVSLTAIFGPSAIDVMLDWWNENEYCGLTPLQCDGLVHNGVEMLDWLFRHPHARSNVTGFILAAVDLELAVANEGFDVALSMFLNAPVDVRAESQVEAAGRFFQFALKTPNARGASLASIVFDVVYTAAASATLTEGVWSQLSPLLPSAYRWRDWDRCERLRRGVCEMFRTDRWPAVNLVEITKDDFVFGQIVDELGNRFSGRRVLKSAASTADPSTLRGSILKSW